VFELLQSSGGLRHNPTKGHYLKCELDFTQSFVTTAM
jgi:hypothetical protein